MQVEGNCKLASSVNRYKTEGSLGDLGLDFYTVVRIEARQSKLKKGEVARNQILNKSCRILLEKGPKKQLNILMCSGVAYIPGNKKHLSR